MYPKGYDPASFVSNSGKRYKPEYIGEPDDDGVIQLVKVGEIDLVELHQRDAYANDVNVLYQRFCNGDITALSQVQGTFMDSLGMPRDLRGMYDMIEGYRQIYDNLTPEQRNGYSFDKWLEDAGSESWINRFVKQSEVSEAHQSAEGAESVQS